MTGLQHQYKDFSIEDFLLDEYFIASVKSPSIESDGFWKEYILLFPEQNIVLTSASSLIKNMNFQPSIPAMGAKERVWKKINSGSKKTGLVTKIYARKTWLLAAAGFIGVIFFAKSWLNIGDSKVKFETQYGAISKLELPDHSKVVLNANSTIEYKKDWKEGQAREVWLKGECFFDVVHLNKDLQHIKESEKFIVHVGDMDIVVLGTSFNVSDRKMMAKVVLQTGSVRIEFKNKNMPSVVMQPGELVKYNQQTNEVKKENIPVEKMLSWKKKELQLNNTTIQDIIEIIEDTYGYKVEVANKEIMNKKLSGTNTISLENEQALFKALELILNVDITIKDSVLLIKSK